MALKRIVYCGNLPSVADELILSQELEVIGIILQKGTITNEMVHLALLREIPIIELNNKVELEKALLQFIDLDAIVICGFGIILSASLLSKRKAYNFHPGSLPDYKGRHPTFFATIAGETTIGMTLHEVTPDIDAGKILAIERIPYGFKENENDLFLKFPLAIRTLLPTLISALNGDYIGIKNSGGNYFKPVNQGDKTFTENDSTKRILNILRAQARYGGGIFQYRGKQYAVKRAEIREVDESLEVQGNVCFRESKLVGIKLPYNRVLEFQEYSLM